MPRVLLCLLVVPWLALAARGGEEDEACLKCHADVDALRKARRDPTRPVEGLLFDRKRFAASVHASQSCGDCHFDYDSRPHSKEAETVACRECHEKAAATFDQSVHAKTGKTPVSCGDCHGVHDVMPSTARGSKLYPLNVYKTCGKCHFARDPARMTLQELLESAYVSDVHGRGILKAGLVVAATCVSCHGGHEIRKVDAPDSKVARNNVDKTCGKCHVGPFEEYRKSVHFLKSNTRAHKGATCTDCHRPHHISRPTAAFLTEAVQACSKCHKQRAGSFRLTYHGKVTTLGYGGRVATCEACHGNHDILPKSDPKSPVNRNNVVATCAQCHKNAHEEFASYMVHADPTDSAKYPRLNLIWRFMNGLLIGTLILGCLHALLWLIRALAAGEWKRPRIPASAVRYIRRWPPSYVAFHLALVTTVLTLAATGLPLHYADQPWAEGLMAAVGGPVVTGLIHRGAAIGLVILGACFVAHLLQRICVRHEKGLFYGPRTLLPRVKDVQDLWGNVRWFLFLAPRPKYGRWTYWEKFDFWAALWGLVVIGLSGLMLWFPVEATRFVPGWFLNAAIIIHGIEALLDIAFIFTVHVFHANLRPDKFPMDTMFFTGRLPEHEFRHERPAEYERALAEGGMERLLTDPPTRKSRITAYVIGTCALLVGFFFVAMMIVALAQHGG